MKPLKNQGQSTTEYLLLIAVATFFAGSFAMVFSPEFSSWIEALEDQVVKKIAGGELLTHPKDTGTVAFSSSENGEGGVGSGDESQEGSSVSSSGEGSDQGKFSSNLGEEEETSGGGSGARGQGGSKTKISKEMPVVESSSSEGVENTPIVEPETKKEEVAQTKKDENELASKAKGMLYREGQEAEALGGSKMNWLRIFIIILIVIIVAYILFEIFKTIRLTKK